ncbi:MAG: acyltransferase family protein [Firmicutes bacterium]|nr:acyltransferase family protein [Bacillota bacterium]
MVYQRGGGKFRANKVYDLYKTIWWYSIILGICGIIIAPDLISIYRLGATLLPVSFNHWWFVTAFIGMMMFSPALNLIIEKSTRNQLLYLVLVGLLLFTIIPTLTSKTAYVSDLLWFCFLYILIGFVRKYGEQYKLVALLKKNVTWIILFTLIFLSTVAFTILERWVPAVREGTNFFTGMYILPQVVASLSVFLCFKGYRIGSNKVINWVGKHIFYVYLIQSNVFFTVMLWDFVTDLHLEASLLFPVFTLVLTITIVVVLVLVSVPLGLGFQLFQKLPPIRLIDRKICSLCGKIEDFWSAVPN